MLPDMAGVPVDTALVFILKTAYHLFEQFRNRDRNRQAFATYMKHVGDVVNGIKAKVPDRAAPVVWELAKLIGMASDTVAKYAKRDMVSTFLHVCGEKNYMDSTMKKVEQLLLLLTAAGAGGPDISAVGEDLLQRASTAANAEVIDHLNCLRAAVESIADSKTTDVVMQRHMTTLQDSMLQLHDRNMYALQQGCAALQQNLGTGIEAVKDSMYELQLTVRSFSEQMLARQHDMHADLKHIKAHLAQLCGVPAAAAQSMDSGRILTALEELGYNGSTAQLQPAPRQPSNNKEWAEAMTHAIANGRLTITSCHVLGLPLMPEGPLRPVTLPCCGVVVSQMASSSILEKQICTVCYAKIIAGETVKDNEAVVRVVGAETLGFAPRLFQTSEVELGENLGSGGEGTVHEGRVNDKAIAVKRVKLPSPAGVKEVASFKQVVATSFVAGLSSPYVCNLHGYCWTDTELWLLMELCEASLAKVVAETHARHKIPGLPLLDVVALGVMLCSALDAVHRSARCLHLDVTPGNVLLTRSKRHAVPAVPAGAAPHHSALRSVRLCDFGLAKRLPTSLRSSMTARGQSARVDGVAKGTQGYAPVEQLDGKAQQRSDVYSMGATLLFAATGVHPFGGADVMEVAYKLTNGTQMPIPETLSPRLRILLEKMTAIDAESRPSVVEVQQELASMQQSLESQGMRPSFIASSHDYSYTQLPGAGLHQGHPAAPQPPGAQAPPHRLQDPGSTGSACKSAGHVQAPVIRSAPLPVELFTSSLGPLSQKGPLACHGHAHASHPGCASGPRQVQETVSGLSREGAACAAPKRLHSSSSVDDPVGTGTAVGKMVQPRTPPSMNCTDQPWSAKSLLLQSVPDSDHAGPLQSTAGDVGASVIRDGEAAAQLTLKFAGMVLPAAAESDTTTARSSCPDAAFPFGLPPANQTDRDRSEVTLAENDIFTVEQLFQFLSQSQSKKLVSMKSAMLPLTSSWPASGGECTMRSLMSTAVDSLWTPESKLTSMINVAIVSYVCGVVDQAVLHLAHCGCIIVRCASSLSLCNVTIEGGLLLCEGKSSLKLTNVKLDDCQLIVTDGATAILDGVQVTHTGDHPAVVISGRGTLVRTEHCGTYKPGEVTLSVAAGNGMLVERGASFIGDRVRIRDVRMQGFDVKDKDTLLQISRSHVECTVAKSCTAVSAAGEAVVELDNCKLKNFADGVRASADAFARVRGCRIEVPVGCSDVAGVRMWSGCVEWQDSVVLNAATGWVRLVGDADARARRKAEETVRPRVDVRINTRTSTDHMPLTRNGIETTLL